MSGHKNGSPKSPLAVWLVTLQDGSMRRIPRSRVRRDDAGYSFTDGEGLVADFPPLTVASVERKDDPVPEQPE